MASCNFENDDYSIVELVPAGELKTVKNKLTTILDTLYDKNVISNKNLDTNSLNDELKLNLDNMMQSSILIYKDGEKVDVYPIGNYNVDITCDGASAKWNNIDKGVTISNIEKKDYKCDVNFITCTSSICDTIPASWINWISLLGYNYKEYNNLTDFLNKEMTVNSCDDVKKFYNNSSGAYDYLKNEEDLIQEINDKVDFRACTKDFEYTGSSVEYKVPSNGIYMLEVYGAQGGAYTESYAGKGGYSVGYKYFEENNLIYITVGEKGKYIYTPAGYGTTGVASFNGGGYGKTGNNGTNGSYYAAGSGGGATHIATLSGTLASIGIENKSNILIVAGGGGGGMQNTEDKAYEVGGSGGGTSGGATSGGSFSGATQTTGYAFGQGSNVTAVYECGGGGGGGFYGGYSITSSSQNNKAGSGGSGYIGGVPAIPETTYKPAMTAGVNSGNGKAKITFAGIK